MRTAVIVLLLVSSTAHARPPRLAAFSRYVAQTETTPLVSWLPSSFGYRGRTTEHISLLLDCEFYRSEVVDSRWTSPTDTNSPQARRIFLALSLGAMVHLGDYAYGLAGVGTATDQLQTRFSTSSDWDDGDATTRPRAFIGAGAEFRREHIGVDLEARAVALGGSAPAPAPRMATPDVSRYALQGSIAFLVYWP